MPVYKLDNPLLVHLVNSLRPLEVDHLRFRETLKAIGKIALPYMLEDIEPKPKRVKLWSGEYEFGFIEENQIVVIAVLRASLPMFDGMMEVLKDTQGGFIAAKRDEKTLQSKIYYKRYTSLKGKIVLIPDPMLATGGTMELVLEEVLKEKPLKVKTLHCVSAPEGLKRVSEKFPQVDIYTIAVDKGLNENGFIIPGLGDAGDRAFNTET
jgi:uracil phosphoribosyltransferase